MSNNAEMPKGFIMVVDGLFESLKYVKGPEDELSVANSRSRSQCRNEFIFRVSLFLRDNRKSLKIVFREWSRDDRQRRRI